MALLMGDSIFSRLVSRYGAYYHPLSASLCVSGAKTSILKALIKSLTEVPASVVLLIGINDLIYPHNFSEVWKSYVSVVNLLLRKGVKSLYVCPLLPVANHQVVRKWGSEIERFNFLIGGLSQKKGVSIISFKPSFLIGGEPNRALYCPVIKTRPDYIHPNGAGLALINSVIQHCVTQGAHRS